MITNYAYRELFLNQILYLYMYIFALITRFDLNEQKVSDQYLLF